ncbi:hypothetical protein ABZ953_06780 [Streptomyces sp. NPDC046465]|uniref:hypothetical protein n=1 Tax=Streptomyces sp. NPDC046465 TaxID=3155810 RepID=UPI00340B9012
MHTHDMRPAAFLAWILGIAFVIACPQALSVALAAFGWLFADPAGTTLLGLAFVASLLSCARSRYRGYTVGRS